MTTEGEARPRRVEVPATAIAEFLATTPLFTGCDRATIVKIAPHVAPFDVPAGVVVVRAGAPNPGIGVVFRGRATVRDGSAATGEVATVGPSAETAAFPAT